MDVSLRWLRRMRAMIRFKRGIQLKTFVGQGLRCFSGILLNSSSRGMGIVPYFRLLSFQLTGIFLVEISTQIPCPIQLKELVALAAVSVQLCPIRFCLSVRFSLID